MPLDEKKNSFNHKERNINTDKAQKDTKKRGVPQNILSSASLTVEAALVFPLFLFLLIGMLFFFRVLQVVHMTYGALETACSKISLETEASEEPFARMTGYFYAALAKEHFPDEYIRSGYGGIRWTGTDLSGEYVDLWIHYDCRIPIRLLGLTNIPITQRVKMKKWTGFQNTSEEGKDGEWVYITPNASVYHRSKECTHLRLSIHIMGKYEVGQSRYVPCSICGNDSGMYAYYYVTDEGEKYHTKLGCSGLKRTLYMVRLSEAGNLGACSRCGGG